MSQNLIEYILYDYLISYVIKHVQISLIKGNCIYQMEKKQWTSKELATLVSKLAV